MALFGAMTRCALCIIFSLRSRGMILAIPLVLGLDLGLGLVPSTKRIAGGGRLINTGKRLSMAPAWYR